MAKLNYLLTNAAVSNVSVPQNAIALWYATLSGNIKIKAKLSDGSIVDVGGSGGGGTGSGYNRYIISTSSTLTNSDWALVDTDCTVTLPPVTAGAYIAVSTIMDADDVVVAPSSGESIIIDSTTSTTEGILLNKKNAHILLFGTVAGWKIIMINTAWS